MTREEAKEFGNMWLQINEDCKDSNTYAFFQMAIKALEQEPRFILHADGKIEQLKEAVANWKPQLVAVPKDDVLDKIKAEIKELATYETVDVLVDVCRIIDKYNRKGDKV